MPSKPERLQTEEARWIAWYKWEFLRRNSAYRKDHQEFMREFGSWFRKYGKWYDETVSPWGLVRLQFFGRAIAPKLKAICEKWQIRDPFSPYWDFTKLGRHYYKQHYRVLLPTDCSREEAADQWDIPEFFFLSLDEIIERAPESTALLPRPDHVLTLKFDLRLPLPSLLAVAKGEITSSKKRYDRNHPPPTNITPAVRRRLDLYDTYLKVWDLQAQDNKFEVIGAVLFPSKPRRAQRALDSFNRAKELINGGYKELR
jgi:hypothetical protein